ncbi:Sodium/hydrogen exchanger family-domain-containing protein [Podospora appendiculata]|uniref:Sodium/hydrogen exchanger family-domain-containing protein n=1 Tax=Podospora appendiculata TaxID=314037 RepID=A0AAE1CD11_9PEZI|nr:Sodium/hydrogen exchanger family-domain-containing protein [Podospora appendiculata]
MSTTASAIIMATITATVTVNNNTTATATATAAAKVAAQGGILEHLNPSVFNPADPIVLFIIQASLVISLTRLLNWPLSKLNEPKVIAEVIAGIMLGPTVLGRIPGFTETVFPAASMPPFRLAANLGLTLYLFLVGLEIDLGYLLSNWRVAASVAVLDMTIPFGLGIAVAWGLYNDFAGEPGTVANISFGVFALFVGVAMAITAFPLLNTTVGVIVMTSGVANDVVGWVLLALCVTLVNAGAGVTALYILLVAAGYSLFLALAVRPAFMWVLRTTRSLDHGGPSQSVVALTIFMVLASAFFTDIIGVHAIFGAFMVGLICPHEGGFAIKLTEKIEDLVAVLFLPLFFALSGLNTNIGLLNTGRIWGYVVAITLVAFLSKVAGGTLGARLNGLVWRESLTIGTLMSCKGLVELIVLNIGLQARILSQRTFTMFVVMALVTTFATTPLVSWLYPPAYQRKLDLWKKGKIDWTTGGSHTIPPPEPAAPETDMAARLLVYLRADGLSSLLSLITHFTSTSIQPLRVHGYRLTELTDRNSSVMAVTAARARARHDPILQALGACAHRAARDVLVSGQVAVVPRDAFADALVGEAARAQSDLLLVPWSETGAVAEEAAAAAAAAAALVRPGDSVFGGSDAAFVGLVGGIYEKARAVVAVGVFVEQSLLGGSGTAMETENPPRVTGRQLTRDACGVSLSDAYSPPIVRLYAAESRGTHYVRVLYDGGVDGLYAVRLALQLAQSEDAQVVVVEGQCLSAEFARIKSAALAGYGGRVVFAAEKEHGGELLALPAESGGSVTVIVGRSVLGGTGDEFAGGSSLSAGGVDVARAIGSAAARVVEVIKAGGVSASLLVVQAKGQPEAVGEKGVVGQSGLAPRKNTEHSQEGAR